MTDHDRDLKAAAIRKEIEEAKAAQHEENIQRKREGKQQVSSPENVEMQSPIESKVKPLKIPMKSKIIRQSSSPGAPGSPKSPGGGNAERGVPGTRLRINQPPGQEIKSILRTNKSSAITSEEQQQKRLSIENLPSVKSKIETYLQAATVEEKPEPSAGNSGQPKSILVKGANKSPRLLHANEAAPVSIYATSATDMSEEEESAGPKMKGMLEVPSQDDPAMVGLRKSRSFSSTVDKEKQDTVMAFFGGTRSWMILC